MMTIMMIIMMMMMICSDPTTDPHGGLGCKACGVQECRLCGEGVYIPCP